MELRQLRYFIAVAEEANFTRAAERVRISQSGVSAQILQLEREFGAQLLDRSGRTVTLTAAGRAALGRARAAVAAADAVQQAVGEITGLLRGRLGIGMVVGCTVTPLFEALAAFHHAHPGIELSLREGISDRLAEAVRAGRLDLALVAMAAGTPEDLEALTISSEPIVALVPPGHPLHGLRRVPPAELVRHPLVCMPAGTGIRTVLERVCAAAGAEPTITVEASAADAIADLAARGLGVGVLSESMAARHSDRLQPLGITGAAIPAVLALIWSATAGNATREFARHCRTAFAPSTG